MAQKNRHAKQAKKAKKRRAAKLRKLITNKDNVKSLWKWFLPDPSIFANLRRHGNAKWQWNPLIFLAICWCWVDVRTLTDAFVEAETLCRTVFNESPVQTFQGFMGALVAITSKVMPLLQGLLQQHMEQLGGKFWRIAGFVPIAFDGSRSTTPRSKSNEDAFCAKNFGKSASARYRRKQRAAQGRPQREKPSQPQEPQVWITMLWHMGFRLAWSWKLGPSDSSERTHVMEMIRQQRFPENTIFCGDAGFVGYPLWSLILLEQKHDFLVRVGANVNLLREHAHCKIEKQGHEGLVLCWPETAQLKNQPPLRLRLIKVQVGKTPAWLLTSVLDRQKLTAATALQLYKMRWGIEVDFRGLKQTLQRGKLRCRNSQRVLAELNWSILAKAVAELWGLKEQLARKEKKSRTKRCRKGTSAESQAMDPVKRSLAQIMRALRTTLRHLEETPEIGQDLSSRLALAVTDSYQRKKPKAARYRPKNKDKKPLGDPKIRVLNKKERKILNKMNAKISV